MFTGIVEALGIIEAIDHREDGYRFRIRLGAERAEGVRIGDSIAICGCCLTVTGLEEDLASFDLIPETMDRTKFRGVAVGDRVNLERSLRFGARLDGHLVQGHVDGVATCSARALEGGEWGQVRFDFEGSEELTRGMVMKGSIAIDGVSLTLIDVQPGRFAVAIIPHTLEVTGFGALQPGDAVNIEVDVVGKWIQKSIDPYLERIDAALAQLADRTTS